MNEFYRLHIDLRGCKKMGPGLSDKYLDREYSGSIFVLDFMFNDRKKSIPSGGDFRRTVVIR